MRDDRLYPVGDTRVVVAAGTIIGDGIWSAPVATAPTVPEVLVQWLLIENTCIGTLRIARGRSQG